MLRATEEQAPVLANLMELYVHDFSELYPMELGQDGRFGYEKLPLYWMEPGRHPLLVMLDGQWAGFALVKRGSEVSGDAEAWDMAEFFIVRGKRRSGLGTAVAYDVWQRYAGAWEIRVMERNLQALAFWQRGIEQFTGRAPVSTVYKKSGELRRLFRFVSTGNTEADI